MSRKPCGRGGCTIERAPGLHRCRWHWLIGQPADVQSAWADARLAKAPTPHRPRVKAEEWPEGTRWCASCQSMIPLFYTSGSRCKACASRAAHASRVRSLYGLPPGDYEALLKFQGGKCYVCRRTPRGIRLAVDHDHKTGAVRGLLCANNENGCNRAVVANLESSTDGGLAAAKRLVAYFEHPPYDQMRGVPAAARRLPDEFARGGVLPQEPPF